MKLYSFHLPTDVDIFGKYRST